MIDLKQYRLILASQSPRRKDLLRGLDLEFITRSANIDEVYPEHLKAEEIPLFLAEQKANAMRSDLLSNDILITADTIVWMNSKAINKPESREEAVNILLELSDSQHSVYTAVQLTTQRQKVAFFSETKVTFSHLENDDIDYYLDKYKPFDKAGAYGIQEWIGYVAVEKIEGSYFNVMGFPVHQVYQKLKTLDLS